MKKLITLILILLLAIPALLFSSETYVDGMTGEGHIIEDEGIVVPQQPILDFVGDGVAATNSPTTGKTVVTINGVGSVSLTDLSDVDTTGVSDGDSLVYNGSSWIADTINSMVYPGAGIPLSTGSAWGTSITDNSSNWNTAYGWGNHASAGYLTSLSGAVLTDQTSGQTVGDTDHRLTKLWATDITCTNAITGSVTGNAGTVTNGVYTTTEGMTWGTGSSASWAWVFNNSGTDVTVTFGSNKVTFSGDLEVQGDIYVNDIFIDNYLATALTVGANGVGGTEGIITLDNGANPGTTATLSYTKWADLEAVTGLVKCNGSGDYSAAGAGDIPDLSATYLPLHSTADAVTNATLTTALTVNTGTLTLTANADNTSVLTIGSGAVSVSGSNTGDQTNISGNAATVTNGVYTTDIGSSVQAYNAYLTTGTIGITIDGGGSAITTGSKGFIYVPYACTISSATLLADQSGSIVIDVKKIAYGSFPSTSSICASAKPTLSSEQNSQDSTLTDWTTSISAGDVLEFYVDSCTTTTRANLILKVVK